jgi:formylglycine-generating enzyme required for sulfatase activity
MAEVYIAGLISCFLPPEGVDPVKLIGCMNCLRDFQRLRWLLVAVCLLEASPLAFAGPWSSLPDAVARLQSNPDDQDAGAVLREAEAAILVEASQGKLAALSALMEVYESLVMPLPDGDIRLERLESRIAAALVRFGDENRRDDLMMAGAAWTLAAGFDPTSVAVNRLRAVLLPPLEPEDGAVWIAPTDGAELVYLPSMRTRVGCSESDRRCRANEIFFRWIDMPGFWIERRETTNSQYRRCVDAGACTAPRESLRFGDTTRGNEPVTGVSWKQARDYVVWVGRRLPSEAGWERAARGKQTRWRFPWGNTRSIDLANVWVEGSLTGRGVLETGSFPATDWGLFDLAGNVWEWCDDRYQSGFKSLPSDGAPMASGIGRVVRGGSWRRGIDLARVSARSWFDEDYSGDDLGFRSAIEPASRVNSVTLLARARRVFAVRVRPGHELDDAELSSQDRRYLERRALTWLLLEERTVDAVSLAAALLKREPRDPVALDFLDQVEETLREEIRAGNLETVERVRAAYYLAAQGDRRLEQRFGALDGLLLEDLKAEGEARIRNRDRDGAISFFKLAMEFAPDDSGIQRRIDSLGHRPGDLLQWEPDQKVMVWIPGGTYRLGASDGDLQAGIDEVPGIDVAIDGFWIDRTEVTNKEYRRCVDDGGCSQPERLDAFDDPNRVDEPVLWVSWEQARAYAIWADKRLPTEAEWERAIRAGANERFPWGNRWDPSMGNAMGIQGTDFWAGASVVGRFPANAWGAVDLIGNAAEWVADVYHINYLGAPRDGRAWEQETGPISERQRVVRGGSFVDPPARQRVSRRAARRPDGVHRATGFRCAADDPVR